MPSLFPFMIITLIFIKTGIAEKASLPLKKVTAKFNMPPAASACFLMSVCSGYPAGSRILTEFYDGGAINQTDCEKLSYLCSTSGPLFIIGSVGYKMFGDKLTGIKILAAHIVAIAVTSLIISLLSKKSCKQASAPQKKYGNILYDTFYSAIISVALAGGFIAFFYVVAQFCSDFDLFFPLRKFLSLFMDENSASAFCKGLIEATTGCRVLAEKSDKLNIALAGALITFGGISIILQQLCYLVKAGVKPLKFISVKALQAAICFVLLLIIA